MNVLSKLRQLIEGDPSSEKRRGFYPKLEPLMRRFHPVQNLPKNNPALTPFLDRGFTGITKISGVTYLVKHDTYYRAEKLRLAV